MATPLSARYQTCKHGLEAVSDSLRMEVAADGIRVVLMEPGGSDTGIWEHTEQAVQRRGRSRYATPYGERFAACVCRDR